MKDAGGCFFLIFGFIFGFGFVFGSFLLAITLVPNEGPSKEQRRIDEREHYEDSLQILNIKIDSYEESR